LQLVDEELHLEAALRCSSKVSSLRQQRLVLLL
jgi:hypothetical protein